MVGAPAAAKELRICADPNNLPYSDRAGECFENRIARLLASDLGARPVFVWAAQWRGFLRKTLNAGLCDVVMGVPEGLERVRTTAPYYHSTYALCSGSGSPRSAPSTIPRCARRKSACS
jgi:mxaJ protein